MRSEGQPLTSDAQLMDNLEQIGREISVCTDCALSRNRTIAVPGEGPADAEIVLIGEAPGFNEDQQGRPFVGAAGHLLNELLAHAGLSREQVFITNTVKCRPLNNRDPLPGEIDACRKYLDRQLEAISPKVIVTLGRYSLGSFLPGEAIGKARGRPRNVDGTIVYPTYHPAAALRQHGFRKVIEEDMQRLPELLKAPPQPAEPERPQAEQLGMF